MRNLITRIAMSVIAFGFFISCNQTYQSLNSTATELSVDELRNQAEEMRNANPNNPTAYHYEGLAYLRLAREQAPDIRDSHYKSMRTSFDTALRLYDNNRSASVEQTSIVETIQTAWSNEHNSAAGLFITDSTANRQRLNLAAAHATNAIIINPDSLISYELLSEIHVKAGNIDSAIDALESVNQSNSPKSGRVFEHIGYLYYHKTDFSSAITWYEESVNWHKNQNLSGLPSDESNLYQGSYLNVRHGLINAYIANQQFHDAISELRSLQTEYPLNHSYSRLLTSQYLILLDEHLNADTIEEINSQLIQDYIDSISSNSRNSPELDLEIALNLIDIGNRFSDARFAEDQMFNLQTVPDVVSLVHYAIAKLNGILALDSENFSAISGLTDAYMLIGNEADAEFWYNRLDR
jgi:predicted negative regulator of RcsB-dependent stress response